jgi:glutamate--cysteine ligase regulatory subunit
MNGGPSIIRRPTAEKSNTELTNSLKTSITLSQEALTATTNGNDHITNGTPVVEKRPPLLSTWTTREDDVLYVPSVDFSASGLAEERSQYDITMKLFYLPNVPTSRRCKHTEEAIALVLKELHVSSIDLLIVSFPDISFDADDEGEEMEENLDGTKETEQIDSILRTWRTLETLHEKGTITQLGLAEFGSERLQRLLPRTKVRPSVDQINVRDCCVVPKSLILYAKQEGIELLTHNDCTNILSRGTVRELLGPGPNGAGLLAGPDGDDGLKGDIEPQWVVKYTAVVRDRGVIENKGYFAVANLTG